jgi:histidinol-phosphate phosphatase family protein
MLYSGKHNCIKKGGNMKYSIEALFIDRDGTIGGDSSVTYPDEFQLYPFTKEALTLAKQQHIRLFAFSNQPGISRGECSMNAFQEELAHWGFEETYICPHVHTENCTCRKPSPEMLLKASATHQLDREKCVVIGDRWSDMLAAHQAGMQAILVKTGAGEEALGKYRHKWLDCKPVYIAENILDAVHWLVKDR